MSTYIKMIFLSSLCLNESQKNGLSYRNIDYGDEEICV